MFRSMLLALAVSSALAFSTGAVRADPFAPKIKASLGPRYAVPDLAVVEFMGVMEGANYILGGKVKNVGKAEYTRLVRSVTGLAKGRKVQLFLVLDGGIGKQGSVKLLRSFEIPALRPGESYSTPTITIPVRQLPGPATAHFLLKITDSDVDTSNDWKQIYVGPVR